MSEAEFEKLVEKYRKGESSLNEEDFLFNNAAKSEPSIEAWSTYAKNYRAGAPKDLNEKLWQSFQNRKSQKRRLFLRVCGTAASIVLLASVFIINLDKKEQSYAEKEKLLTEAQAMFADYEQEPIEHEIFYENEMIVVYTIADQ